MKIGILTFDYCQNYGAVLQAFALKCYLEKQGHTVFFGDYELQNLKDRYTFFRLNAIKSKTKYHKLTHILDTIIKFKSRLKRIHGFKSFQEDYFKKISLSDETVDCWVIGSDQVWNPKITGSYDFVYYGKMLVGRPQIFYAVSCPSNLLLLEQLDVVKKYKYAVGVRESFMNPILTSFGITNTIVLDPTFLLKTDDWSFIALCKKNNKKDYILSYNLSSNHDLPKVANYLANSNGYDNIDGKDIWKTVGPREFLGLFYDAKVTLVSSFHGTAFSVIFHKPFLFFPNNDSRDERAIGLIKSLGLENCIFNAKDVITIPVIDWDNVDRKLQSLRNISEEFLKEAIAKY